MSSIKHVLELVENDKSILTLDLLKPEWKKINLESRIHTTGHCYAASEALYYLFGAKSRFKPMQAKSETGVSHWFLFDKVNNEIIDPTKSQFKEIELNYIYKNAKGRGFMQQSDRSKKIIKKIEEILKI